MRRSAAKELQGLLEGAATPRDVRRDVRHLAVLAGAVGEAIGLPGPSARFRAGLRNRLLAGVAAPVPATGLERFRDTVAERWAHVRRNARPTVVTAAVVAVLAIISLGVMIANQRGGEQIEPFAAQSDPPGQSSLAGGDSVGALPGAGTTGSAAVEPSGVITSSSQLGLPTPGTSSTMLLSGAARATDGVGGVLAAGGEGVGAPGAGGDSTSPVSAVIGEGSDDPVSSGDDSSGSGGSSGDSAGSGGSSGDSGDSSVSSGGGSGSDSSGSSGDSSGSGSDSSGSGSDSSGSGSDSSGGSGSDGGGSGTTDGGGSDTTDGGGSDTTDGGGSDTNDGGGSGDDGGDCLCEPVGDAVNDTTGTVDETVDDTSNTVDDTTSDTTGTVDDTTSDTTDTVDDTLGLG